MNYKILTAVGDNELSKKLRECGHIICSLDIQYKDGIIEYLEINNDVDFIIINSKLPSVISNEELIKKIKNINQNINIIFLNEKNILDHTYKIFDQYNMEEIIKLFMMDEKRNFDNSNNSKIITILGPNGIGKSVFAINLANVINDKKKVIIDFDVLNNSLNYLLDIKKYTNKIQNNLRKNLLDYSIKKSFVWENDNDYDINLKPIAIKTKYNVDLISGINLIIDTQTQLSPSKIRNILLKLKSIYDVIIVDSSTQCFLEYTKQIMTISDELIFLSGTSMYEIKKSKRLLEIYNNEYGIPKEKIYIVFNKCTKNSTDNSILRKIFFDYKVIGNISLNEYYEKLLTEKRNNKLNHEIKAISERGDLNGNGTRIKSNN
jgi:CO dehydrogenase nickel-insertion accessory protein CooC1